MDVFLLRHGIAADRDAARFPNDDDRPLTEDGIARMKEAAIGAAAVIDRLDAILTSPLLRARQTAEIVAKALRCKDRLETVDALKPVATVKTVRELLAGRKPSPVMLVGHEPDLGEIASGLIGATGSAVEFKKGSLCAIHLDAEHMNRPGVLAWHLTPKQLRAIGNAT